MRSAVNARDDCRCRSVAAIECVRQEKGGVMCASCICLCGAARGRKEAGRQVGREQRGINES